MKIAVFIKSTTLHQGFGGMEVQNRLLCEGLTIRGHKVTVFSPKKELDYEFKSIGGVEYVFLPCRFKALFSRLISQSWYNRSLKEFIKRRDEFDLVISQSSAALSIIDNKGNLGVKVLSIAHGTALSELKTYLLNNLSFSNALNVAKNVQYGLRQFFGRQRRFILHSSLVAAVSEFVKKQLLDETYVDESKVVVIHNGIVPFEKGKNGRQDPQVGVNLVFAGQITKEKGSEVIIKILRDERFADCAFHVFGDGPDLPLLHKQFTGKNIKFYGKVTHEELINRFSEMNNAVFLFPTNRIEGFPMILVEAMFAGFPIVAFDMGGVSDAIKDGQTGVLVKQGNLEDFLQKAAELVQNADKRDIIGKMALQIARQKFNLDTMLDKYEVLIKKLTEI